MDLFVINRHDGESLQDSSKQDEQSKLDKLLQKIERNKKTRNKRKEKERVKQEAIAKTTLARKIKRDKKAQIIPVPDNQNADFIDSNITAAGDNDTEPKEENEQKRSDPKQINLEGFTVLGSTNFDKKTKVKRVLPRWLTNPRVISVNLQSLSAKVSKLKELDKSLRKQLKADGVKYWFPVQAEVIPWLLKANSLASIIPPRDICVSAPTGSGKTLAFVLPVIQMLQKHVVKKLRALVILPTQDLAMQVFRAFKHYAQNTNIDVGLITGKNPFLSEQKQLLYKNEWVGYVSKVDILVCTAGRLVDHMKLTEGFDLSCLEFLIIDEADRVLDNIQNDWLYHLEKHIYNDDHHAGKVLNLFTLQKRRPPQKLLFSATLSQDPEKLQKLSLFQPILFTSIVETDEERKEAPTTDTFIGKYTTPNELSEKYVVCTLEIKPLILYKLIKSENLKRILIFTNSGSNTHRLTLLLKSLFKGEVNIEEISANLQGKNRKELIDRFSTGSIDILISTDALARGIDLPKVECVVNYSAPKYVKTYIHRVGRTARAGESGLAVTLAHKSQLSQFKTLLQHAQKSNIEEIKISEDDLEDLADQYRQALDELKANVLKEEKEELKKIKASKMSKKKGVKRKRVNSVTE